MSEASRPERAVLWLAILVLLIVVLLGAATTHCDQHPHHGYERGTQENHEYCATNSVMLEARVLYRGLHRYREDINAFSTSILALFTVVLAVATYKLWRTTESHAEHLETSANAAMLTAKNMLRVSRPLCVLEQIILTEFEGAVPQLELPKGHYLASLQGIIQNKGSADAFARTMQTASSIGNEIGEPLIPAQEKDVIAFGFGQLKAGGDYRPPFSIYQIPVTHAALNGEERLFVYGWLRYADIHGIVRRSGFAFEWFVMPGIIEGHFTPSGPSSYWYDVEEDSGS